MLRLKGLKSGRLENFSIENFVDFFGYRVSLRLPHDLQEVLLEYYSEKQAFAQLEADYYEEEY